MNNFGRAVLAVGLSAVMTFTNPGCFFQAGAEPVTVYASETKTVQSRMTAMERTSTADSGEGGSTTEVTTEKKQETTTGSKENTTSSEKNTGSSTGKNDSQTEHTTESGHNTSGGTSDSTSGSTSGSHSGDSGQTGSASGADSQTESNNKTQSGASQKNNNEDNAEDSAGNTTADAVGSNVDSTAKNKAKKNISTRQDAELQVKNSVKNINNQLAEEAAPDGSDKSGTFIPKIYNDTRLAMKNNKEYIAGYVYFNQTDSAWNQNGYCIARAGCGPTSMAVVITSLTGKWVTPLDTAIWGYQHGFYSRAGSSHAMIPAMAAAYGLKCQGVGTDYNAIKKALKAGKPVVCLMGPGYFTRGGHFMVLVAIDKNDCVTIADVGSRTRSAYKYRLSDVIAQSKGASAGGPFWIMSYDKESRAALRKKQAIKNYTQEDMIADFADVSYMKVKGDLPATLKEEKKEVSVKKVVSILKMSTGENIFGVLGAGSNSALAGTANVGNAIFSPISRNSQMVVIKTGETDTAEQNSADAGKAEQNAAGQSAEQENSIDTGKEEQNAAGQSTVQQNSADAGKAEQNSAGQSAAQQNATGYNSTRQNLALTLKQDIARRQWEKRIPLSKLENYLKGTIEK